MMSPRYDGSVTSPCVSVSEERGLANCPATPPTFTTPTQAPQLRTPPTPHSPPPPRQGGAEGQPPRHLKQHAEAVADDIRGEVGEALGTVTALQHERPAFCRRCQMGLQPTRLAGEHQRRIPPDALLHRRELLRV